MLSTDEIIVNILLNAKQKEHNLLKHFKIGYPSQLIAEESNSIFVASVDSESNGIGYEHQSFVDRVEVLIVTKNKDYQKAIQIIKTVSREIIRLVMANSEQFDNKPIVERVTPEYNRDFVLTRGHIMFRVNTNPDDFSIEDDYYTVCQILTDDMEVDTK